MNYETRQSGVGMAVFASHSALQLVLGGMAQGVMTALFGHGRHLRLYRRFPGIRCAFVEYSGPETLDRLADEGFVLVPNGSVVEYVRPENLFRTRIRVFGSRELLRVEADQHQKMELLKKAGIPIPKTFAGPSEVDRPVIVKLPGARGGMDYRVTEDPQEVRDLQLRAVSKGIVNDPSELMIQEYLIGATMYAHYFHSPIYGRTEITGFDIRYESDVDGLRRAPVRIAEKLSPTFTVVGNIPVFPRERLLETFLDYGERFVETVRRELGGKFAGPFCLECVVDSGLNVIAFEFSGRIVAGTNVYSVHGSPYLALYFGRPMTVGERVAHELKIAAETGSLEEVLT
jgi:5-formaminoimidazole-4-carboxamide-1-(beta)-D-ribofuranosyl 5'-monophosphate synthetase